MIEFETDSRKVKNGQTFVAIKGFTVDGHDFINKAIENGASKLIVEKNIDTNIPFEIVDNTKDYLINEIPKKYADEINKLNIIGITGTNGKTTTSYLTYQMLKSHGINAAYIGTIGFYYGDTKRELPNTTPDIINIYNLLFEAIENNCTHVVMEVSSHSLVENRIAGIKFNTICFTNLSQDHLDFHKSMENYLEAKTKILNYLKEDATIIVNSDDNAYSKFLKENHKHVLIGYENNPNVKINDAILTPINTTIDFTYFNENHKITNNLISKFNVYNFMMCYCIMRNLSITHDEINGLAKDVNAPKGRCEIIQANEGYAVVDYAHTPDAVEKVINSFNEFKQGNIITIIGCGGDRDPLKRPIMGKIACMKSDYVIFTNDNPRTEDPQNIMNDITKDLEYTNYKVILDREEAIKEAITNMKKNDIVLILGKGHEDYQIIGREKIHFDDKEIVLKYKN